MKEQENHVETKIFYLSWSSVHSSWQAEERIFPGLLVNCLKEHNVMWPKEFFLRQSIVIMVWPVQPERLQDSIDLSTAM